MLNLLLLILLLIIIILIKKITCFKSNFDLFDAVDISKLYILDDSSNMEVENHLSYKLELHLSSHTRSL